MYWDSTINKWAPPRSSRGIPLVSTTLISLNMEMSRLTRDGTAETVSRDQIFRREREQGNIHFPCSADHEQDGQPYPVDPCVVCVCVYVCCHPVHSERQVYGRTSRGHTGGTPHRISPPSFCGACLNFSREKDSAVSFPRRP